MADPPRFSSNDFFERGWGLDTAKYLVNPGNVIAPDQKHPDIRQDPGNLAHIRPYLWNGELLFLFPVGVEEFRATGDTKIGLYHYIGDNAVDGVVTHYEEGRITLAGTFPGLTAQENMVDLRNILRAPPKQAKGLTLFAQGVFDNEQYVLPESWEFSHDREDRSHSIEYTITLVRTGDKRKLPDPTGGPPAQNPGRKTKPRGKPARTVTIKSGMRTLRAVATSKHTTVNHLVMLNSGQLNDWKRKHPSQDLSKHKIATYRWPIGHVFRY
jgi:hypothetical protein